LRIDDELTFYSSVSLDAFLTTAQNEGTPFEPTNFFESLEDIEDKILSNDS